LRVDILADDHKIHRGCHFALHIAINELPDRLDEIPRDKFIITMCLTGFRAAMAYAFLGTPGLRRNQGPQGAAG
jgi:hypothetical protein